MPPTGSGLQSFCAGLSGGTAPPPIFRLRAAAHYSPQSHTRLRLSVLCGLGPVSPAERLRRLFSASELRRIGGEPSLTPNVGHN